MQRLRRPGITNPFGANVNIITYLPRRVRTTRHVAIAMLALGVVLSGASPAAQAKKEDPLHVWVGGSDPASLEAWVNARLAHAEALVRRITAVHGKHTLANTLKPYDEASNQLALANNETYLLLSLAPAAQLRAKAQDLNQKVSAAQTDLGLNQAVYHALRSLPTAGLDAATKHYVERTLLEYRLGGVDKDDATREKVKQLQDRNTSLTLKFGENIQNDVRSVMASAADLEGLPADFIARHKADADGTYTITTDEPDFGPVMSFAKSATLRRALYLAYNQRAYPTNKDVLLEILQARQELATTLGYPTYADFATADQMLGNAANVQKLLDDVDAASRDIAQREFGDLMAFVAQQQPGTKEISASDIVYWQEQYGRSHFNFDAQSVRPYFPYSEVEQGVLDTAGRLFRVQFKRVANATVWDPSVATFDVFDSGKRIGRLYLDMHPREGKDKWFWNLPLVSGIKGEQLPEAVLNCNFSGGVAGDPGLMQFDEVVTFFHEFGHMMHHLLGSQTRWSGAGGMNVENDFVEAPSQMLEEFFSDRGILASFAHHYQTGEVIPADLVARMNAAAAFGRGTWVQRQLLYATYSLQVHDRDPAKVDLDALLKDDYTRFQRTSFVDGNRMYATFTHLANYTSNYYTYVWDKVIAIDFFAQFDRDNLVDGPTAMRYRRSVLEPGATKPAAHLVRDFLGRDTNLDALRNWMGVEYRSDPSKP
jgi:thimet oligopeptidase